MTPSQLLKLNKHHYKLIIFLILVSLSMGVLISKFNGIKINNKYELLIVEDINTKFLIDKVYKREGTNNDDYYKYLKNFTVSQFISSKFNKNGEINIGGLDINSEGEYFIVASFNSSNLKTIEEFDKNLKIFLEEMQIRINNQITETFQYRIGKSSIGIKANSQLYFKKNSVKKGNDPSAIIFAAIIFGLIIANFIIILENPPKNKNF